MVNYQLGKIYTIRSLTSPEIYVGSTTAPLCKRMAQHRDKWKLNLVLGRNKEIVKDISDWFIELYENYPCNKLEELTRREGKIIREIGTLNKNIAGRTDKEYYIDNADKIKEYRKEYCIENADKIKEKNKEYNIKNADKIKEYRIGNADKMKEYNKEYNIKNANKIKENRMKNADKIKQYRINNVDKIKEYCIKNADKIKETSKQNYLKRKLAKSQITT